MSKYIYIKIIIVLILTNLFLFSSYSQGSYSWDTPPGSASGTPNWGNNINLIYDGDEGTKCYMEEVGQGGIYFGAVFSSEIEIKGVRWKNHSSYWNSIRRYRIKVLQSGGDPANPAHWIEAVTEKNTSYNWNEDIFSTSYMTTQVRVEYTSMVYSAPVYEIQFAVPSANHDPEFTSSPINKVLITAPYDYLALAEDIDVTDPPGDLVFSNSSLPTWLTLINNGNGTANLTGTPSLSDIGTYNIDLTVSDDNGGSSTQSFTIEVIDIPYAEPGDHAWGQPAGIPRGTPNWGQNINNIYDGNIGTQCNMDEVGSGERYFSISFDKPQAIYGIRWKNYSSYWNHIKKYKIMALIPDGNRTNPADWFEIVALKNAVYNWNEDNLTNPIEASEIKVIYTEMVYSAPVYEIEFDYGEITTLIGELVAPDAVLDGHWSHVKNHQDSLAYYDDFSQVWVFFDFPSMISPDPDNENYLIPYAFLDGPDVDGDGISQILPEHYTRANEVVYGVDYELTVVSESASYALLRAVWMQDKTTFDKVWNWTTNNLQRCNIQEVYDWDAQQWKTIAEAKLKTDHLFAWRWLPTINGTSKDGIIIGTLQDESADVETWVDGWGFASDADEDIALALIFADELWGSSGEINYAEQAQLILDDLFTSAAAIANGKRYLNGGTGFGNDIEPGYLAPASYRIFEHFDPNHSWIDFVETSYNAFREAATQILTDENGVSYDPAADNAYLLPDWIRVNNDETFEDAKSRNEPEMGADAFRAYWRIAMDYKWFNSDSRFNLDEAYDILKEDSPCGPHNFIERHLDGEFNWLPSEGDPTEYTETSRVPRIMGHDGRYIANEWTGAGLDDTDSGNRADIGPYAVWLSFYDAINDTATVDKLADPLLRYDINWGPDLETGVQKTEDKDGYTYGTDGWIRDSNDVQGGYYWTFQDHSNWNSDTEYFSSVWAWFGLGLYEGRIQNHFTDWNTEPSMVNSINLYNESDPAIQITEINELSMIVEVNAVDSDGTKINFIYVTITSSDEASVPNTGPITVKCAETGPATGIFKGNFKIAAFSNDAKDEIAAQENNTLLTLTAGDEEITAYVTDITYDTRILFDACDKNLANTLNGYWYETDDNSDDNNSTIHNPDDGIFIIDDGIDSELTSVMLDYTLDPNPINPDCMFVLLGTQLYNPDQFTPPETGSFDLNDVKGMSFWMKGNGKEVSVILRSKTITDNDDYHYKIDTTYNEWRQYYILFDEEYFKQGGFGTAFDLSAALSNVEAIQFKASSGNPGEIGNFYVDQIYFLGAPAYFVTDVDDFEDEDVSDWWFNHDVLEGTPPTQDPVITVVDDNGSNVMQIDYQMGTAEEIWLSLGKNLSPRDLTDYLGISFDFYGTNSKKAYKIELTDNGNEKFVAVIRDTFTGWQNVNIPFSTFTARTDYQPEDAVLNGIFDKEGIRIVAINILSGSGTIKIDNIIFTQNDQMIPPVEYFDADFEDGTLQGFYAESAGLTITSTTEQKSEGDKSMKLVLNGGTQRLSYNLPSVSSGETILFDIFIESGNNIKGVLPAVLDKNWGWSDKWHDASYFPTDKWETVSFTINPEMEDPLNRFVVEIQPIDGETFNNITVYIDNVRVGEPLPPRPEDYENLPNPALYDSTGPSFMWQDFETASTLILHLTGPITVGTTQYIVQDLSVGQYRNFNNAYDFWYTAEDAEITMDPNKIPGLSAYLEISNGGAVGTDYAIKVSYDLIDAPDEVGNPGAGYGSEIVNGTQTTYDLSSYDGMGFIAKKEGGTQTLIIEIHTTDNPSGNSDIYHYTVKLEDQWQKYAFKWEDLVQFGWGTGYTFNPSNIYKIQVVAKGFDGIQGTFYLDEIKVLKLLQN